MNVLSINAFANFMGRKTINPIKQTSKLNYEIKDTVSFSGQKSAGRSDLYGKNYEVLEETDITRTRTIPQMKEAYQRGEDITEDEKKLVLSRVPVAHKDAKDFVSKHPEFSAEDVEQDLLRIIVEKTNSELKSTSKTSTFGTGYERSRDRYFEKTLKHDADTISLDEVEISANPYEIVEEEALKDAIKSMLKTLTPREQLVIKQRFGFDGQDPQSREKIAKDLNISYENVRSLEEKAIKKLRHPSRSKMIRPFLNE